MSGYRKIFTRMWDDENFFNLSPKEKLLALYILTAQSNRIGIFTFSIPLAAEHLGSTTEALGKCLNSVCETLVWHHDKHSRTIYIPTWWKYNVPDNKNRLMGNMKDVCNLSVSRDNHLFVMFSNNLTYIPDSLIDVFKECLASTTEALSKHSANTRQLSNSNSNSKETTLVRAVKGCQENIICEKDFVQGSGKSPDPEPQQVSPVLDFPLAKKGETFSIYQADVDQWKETFPGIDVLAELRKCRQWNVDNPHRRKTKAGIRRHISAWLGKAQNRGPVSKPWGKQVFSGDNGNAVYEARMEELRQEEEAEKRLKRFRHKQKHKMEILDTKGKKAAREFDKLFDKNDYFVGKPEDNYANFETINPN